MRSRLGSRGWRFLLCCLFFGRTELLETGTQAAYLASLDVEFLAHVGYLCVEAVELVVFYGVGEHVLDALEEVAQDVHVVGEGVVLAVVDAPVDPHAVVLGGHEAEVVGGLQAVPVLLYAAVAAGKDASHDVLVVELVEGFALHAVAQQAARVAFFVVPADGVGDFKRADGLVLGEHLGWCGKLYAHLLAYLGQGA